MSGRKWTMAEIRACNADKGHYWFSRGATRFFGSKIGRSVYQGPGGIYFVTSEGRADWGIPRRHSIRKFDPSDCSVKTVGDVQRFAYDHVAKDEAKRLARGGSLSGLRRRKRSCGCGR